jgi:hypothetical protein
MKNYKATIICVLATIVQLCDILTQIELYLNQLTSTQVLFIHISLPGMPASDYSPVSQKRCVMYSCNILYNWHAPMQFIELALKLLPVLIVDRQYL